MADVLVEFEDLGDAQPALIAFLLVEAVDMVEECLDRWSGTAGDWKRARMRLESYWSDL